MLNKNIYFYGLHEGKELPGALMGLEDTYKNLAAAYAMQGLMMESEVFAEAAEEFAEMRERFDNEIFSLIPHLRE